jgi:hypothetical protein
MKENLKNVYRTAIGPIQSLYMRVRNDLPTVGHVTYSGVKVAIEKKPFDVLFPKTRGQADIDDYEHTLISALKTTLKPGMKVIVVGGGYGVTACVAAQLVGKSGKVICYEGNLKSCEHTRRAAILNNVDVKVVEGIVGEDLGVYHGTKSSRIVSAGELPLCDVLELDCEGAEYQVIANLPFLPPVILVETHGFLGSSTGDVARLLGARGYHVTHRGVAEPRLASFCEKNDVYVLLAQLPESFSKAHQIEGQA